MVLPMLVPTCRRQDPFMWPQEHGAYGQITFPLLTAFLVAGVSAGGLLVALAMIAGFLAHEPAAVLFGLRGARRRRERRQRALLWLTGTAGIAVLAGVGAALTIDSAAAWSLAVPVAPGAFLAIAAVKGSEHSWYGETAASLAFAGGAVPVCLAAHASLETSAVVAIPFALLFVASTLAVRVVILKVRGGGDARAMTATRVAAISFAGGASACLGFLVARGFLPVLVVVAASPGLLTAAVIAAYPPRPNRLRTLGWTLIAVSVLTAAILVATVRE